MKRDLFRAFGPAVRANWTIQKCFRSLFGANRANAHFIDLFGVDKRGRVGVAVLCFGLNLCILYFELIFWIWPPRKNRPIDLEPQIHQR